jgi:NAD(P)-dependent dehydrogenase (short-subunit alcohol dehydrogenase family)
VKESYVDLELTGKRAVVTGGSRGIGLAAASRLVGEGASVVIVGRRADALAEATAEIAAANPRGTPAIAISADVATPEGARAAVDGAVKALGGLDIVVNNAGRSAAGPALEHSDEEWIADLDLKLFAALRISRLAVPHLAQAGGGRIVNVTAIGGKHPGAGSAPSSVSRAAGIALTKVLSKELAPSGILVNTVCIGLIESEQIEMGARRRFPGVALEEAYRHMAAAVPLGRVGKAAEAGDVIAFLCSGRASYLTGVAINIDGGMSSNV